MKSNYYFHFRVKSGVSLNDRSEHQKNIKYVYLFKFGDDEIFIKDNVKKIDEFNIFNGLDLYVGCNNLEKENAIDRAKNLSEMLLSLMSFTSLSYIGSAKLLSILDTKNNKNNKFNVEFNIFDDENINMRSLTKLNKETFSIIWDKFDKLEDKSRLLRSISWLRKGFNEKSIDQFLAYFIGVEILSKPLNILFNVSSNEMSFWEKIFKRNVVPNKDDWQGVKKIFNEKLGFQEFKKIKNKRNEILHGYKKLDNKLIKEAESYIEILRKALMTSQCMLLGLDEYVTSKIIDQRWSKFNPSRWTVIGGELNKMSDDNLGRMINFYPQVVLNKESKIEGINKKGELTVTEKANYDFLFSSDIKFNMKYHELWSEDNSGILNMKINDIK